MAAALLIVGIVAIVTSDEGAFAAPATVVDDGVNNAVDNGMASAVVVIVVVATLNAVVVSVFNDAEIVNFCFVAGNFAHSLMPVSCCWPIIWLTDGHGNSVAGTVVGCKIALVAAAIASVDVVFVDTLVSAKLLQDTFVVVANVADAAVALLTDNVGVLLLDIQMSDSLLQINQNLENEKMFLC